MVADEQIHAHAVSNTLAFAPEAKGRTQSLYYDSTLLAEYDCSYQMPLVAGLRPFPEAA